MALVSLAMMVVASMGSVAKRAPCFSHAFRAQACKDAAQGLGKPRAEQFPGFSVVLWVVHAPSALQPFSHLGNNTGAA